MIKAKGARAKIFAYNDARWVCALRSIDSIMQPVYAGRSCGRFFLLLIIR